MHTFDEVKLALENDQDPYRRAVGYLAYAGLSLGEIHALRAGDIEDSHPTLPGRGAGRGLTREEAVEVLAAVKDKGSLRDQVIVEAAMLCGLRQCEMRRLRLGDITRRHGRMFLRVRGKGGKAREVYVPAALASRVESLASGEGDHLHRSEAVGARHVSRPLFQGPRGTPLTANGMRWIIDQYIKPTAPHVTAHGLRHTSLTWLLNTGASLDEAMEIAGHSEVASHEVYAAMSDGWFVGQWRSHHPIARWGVGVSSVVVRGRQGGHRIARGVERVVPLPSNVATEIRDALLEQESRGSMSKKMLSWVFVDQPHNLTRLRELGAIHMAESGAHPFLIGALLGVTTSHVVGSRYDRRGTLAEDGRVNAMERVAQVAHGAPSESVSVDLRAAMA